MPSKSIDYVLTLIMFIFPPTDTKVKCYNSPAKRAFDQIRIYM